MKKPRCPTCKSSKLIPIIYGYPRPEAEKEAIQGKIKLGGCEVWGVQPHWHCKNCERDWTNIELEQMAQGKPEPITSADPKRWHKGMRHTRGPWTLRAKAWGFEVRHARSGVVARIKGRSWHTAEPNA